MYLYKKVAKRNNVTYTLCQNNRNSRHSFVLCDFSRSKYAEAGILDGDIYEVVVAWVDNKTKSIEWNSDTESMIDKDVVRNSVVVLI